jgi:enoyl-CoA hydratase
MNYETLLLSIEHRVAVLTINRPDKLNALNATTKRELKEALTALRDSPDVDVVIVTGSGEKAFVAGTDIGELTALQEESGSAFAAGGQALLDFIENLGKPVIAAVNGYALGGGCELALACHIRIASENAKFGQPEANLGIIPGYGGTQRLARLVGKGRAMEMILTGAQVDANEAYRIGLANKVVPASELLTRARYMAQVIVSMGQVAVRTAMEAVNAIDTLSLTDGLRKEAELFGRCCASEDFHEGTTAFLEKRKPAFKNR